MARKVHVSLSKLVGQLTKAYTPDQIQRELARVYALGERHARNQAEYEFWTKCRRASKNLASGMEKWLEEMLQEDDRE